MTRPDGPGTYAAFLSGLSTKRRSGFVVANAAGGVLWSGTYAGAYALGNAASSTGSAITIVGLAVAGVLMAATIVIGRRSLRRIEQRAEDAAWAVRRAAADGLRGQHLRRALAQTLVSGTAESEVGDPWVTQMRSLPTTVVSTTLKGPLSWPGATVVSGDAVDVVARLKQESGVPCARTAACR
jgi:hypothetical protein